MQPDRLSSLDVAFLSLERPDSPMHLGAAAVFRPARQVNPIRLVDLLAERAARVPRLRHRALPTWLPVKRRGLVRRPPVRPGPAHPPAPARRAGQPGPAMSHHLEQEPTLQDRLPAGPRAAVRGRWRRWLDGLRATAALAGSYRPVPELHDYPVARRR